MSFIGCFWTASRDVTTRIIEARCSSPDESADYMLTGSLASSIQGALRLTDDIDLVVALSVRRR